VIILSKKSDHRSREEVKKLVWYFKGLSFFESLKKDAAVDEDIIYQCCRELRYRKYDPNQPIIKYGEEGHEFFIIIEGTVSILTPKVTEIKLQTLQELYDYIDENNDFIIWERSNKHLQHIY
jgi:hypothetical protein